MSEIEYQRTQELIASCQAHYESPDPTARAIARGMRELLQALTREDQGDVVIQAIKDLFPMVRRFHPRTQEQHTLKVRCRAWISGFIAKVNEIQQMEEEQ